MLNRTVQPVTVPPRLADLLAHASIEVTARDIAVADRLHADFPLGIDVHVTFLPKDDIRQVEETCARLRQAGFNPVPHLTARNFASHDALDVHLARLSEMADITRALVIAGDVDRPRGPFASSLDVMQTGLLQKHGINSVLVAGHPEGHPAVTEEVMRVALCEKVAYARETGLDVQIVTQFCFDANTVVNWLVRIRRCGIDAPLRIGVAGPASTASLMKFAMHCGIGNSLRALRTRGSAIGKLLGETTPEALLRALEEGWHNPETGAISGIHFYMFGGQARTAKWLSEFVKALDTEAIVAAARDRTAS
jgi:methylenetetrahydrofolate reductase (NADH)